MLKIKIAPSILAADFANMGAAIEKITACGADLVHCDVMDGSFVPPITFGAQMIKAIRPYTQLPLDCHLMTLHPETHLNDFAAAGANLISVHVEACKEKLPAVLKSIKALGVKAAAVINPETPASALYDVVELADMLLVMSVHPGWGGQKLIPETLGKIAALRELCIRSGKPDMDIEIDGGVTEENISTVIAAGANVIVAGSTVFKSPDMKATIARLKGE